MLRKPKTKDEFEVLPATTINPKIADLMAKRMTLSAEKAELEKEDRELAQSDGPSDAAAARELRVAEILGRVPPQRVVPPRGRRQEIAERIRDIEQALGVLDRDIETERRRASATARERILPEYRRRIGELAKALASAHTAQIAIRGLTEKVGDADLSTSWMNAHHAAWLDTGRHGSIGRFLHELRNEGLVPESAIPAEVKE